MLSDSGISTPQRWHLTIFSVAFDGSGEDVEPLNGGDPVFLPNPLNNTHATTAMIIKKTIFPIAPPCVQYIEISSYQSLS
jgi:hypothetical protein